MRMMVSPVDEMRWTVKTNDARQPYRTISEMMMMIAEVLRSESCTIS